MTQNVCLHCCKKAASSRIPFADQLRECGYLTEQVFCIAFAGVGGLIVATAWFVTCILGSKSSAPPTSFEARKEAWHESQKLAADIDEMTRVDGECHSLMPVNYGSDRAAHLHDRHLSNEALYLGARVAAGDDQAWSQRRKVMDELIRLRKNYAHRRDLVFRHRP